MKVSTISKIYYVIISVADLMFLIFWIVEIFLSQSLFIIKDGTFYIHVTHSNLIQCKILYTLMSFTENFGKYTILALGIERMIAVLSPIRSEYLGTKRNTFGIIVISTLIGSSCPVIYHLVYLNYMLMRNLVWKVACL